MQRVVEAAKRGLAWPPTARSSTSSRGPTRSTARTACKEAQRDDRAPPRGRDQHHDRRPDRVQNVIKCVHGAGFDVEDVVCQGLAGGEGVLSDQEIDLGVCLVEIGAGTTDVVVYNEGSALPSRRSAGRRQPRHERHRDRAPDHPRRGGDTEDQLRAHPPRGDRPRRGGIEVRQVGRRPHPALPRRFLAEIIGPRMREIFQMAREEVRQERLRRAAPGRRGRHRRRSAADGHHGRRRRRSSTPSCGWASRRPSAGSPTGRGPSFSAASAS